MKGDNDEVLRWPFRGRVRVEFLKNGTTTVVGTLLLLPLLRTQMKISILNLRPDQLHPREDFSETLVTSINQMHSLERPKDQRNRYT